MDKWEKHKKKEVYHLVTLDEFIASVLGVIIFTIPGLCEFRFIFILLVIVWYWLKLKYCESKIHRLKQTIYNVYYDNCRQIPQKLIDARTEKARQPMFYNLEQLEKEREFLVSKFVVINLVLAILQQAFLK